MKWLRLDAVLRWHELPLLLGLILTWMLLWREISLLTLLSGAVMAIVTMRLFYLPPVILAGRLNIFWALRYLGYFLLQLAIASFQVAWLALRPGNTPPTAIVENRLRTRSDLILTLVALTMSLIPGSLVVEVDRFASTLYLHVLNVSNEKEIEAFRKQVALVERLLINAVGSREEMEAVR